MANSVPRLDPLHGLLGCLRGQLPAQADWPRIIGLANKTLCTPAVSVRLREAGLFPALPADVATFFAEMERRNGERNDRLMKQLDEAAAAMNAAGVSPVLLKGTAWLVHAPPERRAARMLADIDLMVPANRFHAMIDQLRGLGYHLETTDLEPGVPAVLFRPQDAATIDLHTEYGATTTLFYRFDDLAKDAALLNLEGGIISLPSPVACIAILLLHDQLKGRDYLRGRIDLRHLLDIHSFASQFTRADWAGLNRLFRVGYARNAMRTQLLTAAKLLDMDVPRTVKRGVRARLQYIRRLIQLRWPSLAPALTFLSLLDPSYLAARQKARRAGRDGISKAATGLPRRESLERLFVRNELGKI